MAKFIGVASGVASVALALGAQATVVRELYDPDAGHIAAAQLALDFLTTDPPAGTDALASLASPTRNTVLPLPGAAGPSFASHAGADPVARVMAGDDALRLQPTPAAAMPSTEATLSAHAPGVDTAVALPTGESGSYGWMALAVAAAAMLAGIVGAAGAARLARLRRR